MDPKHIAVIGSDGKYGSWLVKFLTAHGHDVIPSDLETGPGNASAVTRADVVIFSVPISVTSRLMKRLAPYSRSDQLWMDVTSLKEPAVEAMLCSKAEVVGLHPMCAPPKHLSLRGQVLVVCEGRLNAWREWFGEFEAALNPGQIKRAMPIEHDKVMAVVQGLLHACHFGLGDTIRHIGADVALSLGYASPIYRMAMSHMGRVLKQDPRLYAELMMYNRHVPDYLAVLAKRISNLSDIVVCRDIEKFMRLAADCRRHFGDKVMDTSFQLFENLLGFMIDLDGENTLVFKTARDEPGLLMRILIHFVEEGVNLVSFHGRHDANTGLNTFILQTEQPKDDIHVQRAAAHVTENFDVTLG